MRRFSTRIALPLMACLLIVLQTVSAQVGITPGATVSQNFNGIGTTDVVALPSGWKADKVGTVRTVGTYAAAVTATERSGGTNLSSSASNGIYHFGATADAADRAIGGLSSGSATQSANVYVDLLNNGNSIPSFTISYSVEKYRGGSNAAGFRIQLYYSLNGTSWTAAGTDFLSSFAADANNNGYASAPGAISTVSLKTLPVSVPAGGHLYLAWNYSVSSGTTTTNAQALSVDDIVITAASSANADLASLSVSSGSLSPSFNSATTSYSVAVPNSTGSISVTPATSGTSGSITVNGNAVASGNASAPVTLAVGTNTLNITVTAQDGVTTKTYTLTITRAAPATPVLTATTQPAAFGNTCVNNTAGPSSFTFDGSELDGSNLVIAAIPGYLFSENAGGPYAASLSLTYSGSSFTAKTIYIQFQPAAAQSYDAAVQVTGGGTALAIPVSGTGINTPPTVTTGTGTVTASSVTLQGTISTTGCSAITSYGIEYSTTSGFTGGTQVISGNLAGGSFSATVSGLNANTTYYYRAFAANSGGTAYGTQSSFTTRAVPVVMSGRPLMTYSENFDNISAWGNGFTGNADASHFAPVPVNATGTIPDGMRITTNNVFSSGTSGGVQKGTGNIVLLSTGGSPENSSSTAFDLFLDFTGVNAGTISFDWAGINNSTGDRFGSMRVYASADGITFTELSAASVLNVANNAATSGSVSLVNLPASFHNNANARLRFYYHNGTGGTTGSRPKISIDNLVITALSTAPCVTPAAPATNLVFGTATETSIPGSFTAAASGAHEYLVVMSSSSSLTSMPLDGQVYNIGDNVGDGAVIARGPSLSFNATGLDDGNTYYFFVFPVNSVCTGGPKYNTTDVLTAGAATPAGLPDCAAPAAQATALQLVSGTTNVTGSFTAANGADEYLVVRSLSTTLTASPVNGQVYNANDILGNGTVVYRGTATNFTAAGLTPNTAYHFFLFSAGSLACVNGPAYQVVAPLTGSVNTQPLPVCSTPSAQPANLALTASNNSIAGTFNAAANGDAYLVVVSTSNTLSAVPADNTDYTAGTSLGGGTVVGTSTATSFSAPGLTASTTYYVFVFAANKTCTGGTKYLAANPLTGTATTTNAPVNNVYFGNLHAHSDYSDGNQDNPGYTPTQDYQYALGSQGMDFLGISEHNHYSTENNPGTLISKYHSGTQEAKAFTQSHPGFLALYGMEWGVISGGGHVVIYGDEMDKLFGWETNVGGVTGNNYDVFVPKNTYTGPTGLFKTINDHIAYNTFATLAHPNNTDYGNISNIAYDQVADDAIVGTAVANGPSTSTNTTYSNPASSMSYLWYYQKMLSKGYHLGPVIDHDNHKTTFGRTTYARTAVIAPALTQTEIIKAMRDMRFYATEDVDAKVDFTINTRTMGSVFTDRNAPSVSITLNDATTSTSNAVIRLMYGVPGSGLTAVKIDSVIGNTLHFVHDELPVNSTGYYYVDITNENKRIVTSPIWYTRTCVIATDTTATVCGSFSWQGTTYTTSGTFAKNFTTAGGCDSTVTLHLTVNQPATADTTATACGSFTWYGTTYTASGTAQHTLTTTGGCDSVVTLHLTIYTLPAPATISAAGPTAVCPSGSVALQAAATGNPGYQWLLGNAVIAGANAGNYTATTAGQYRVRITDQNNCTSLSNSITVTMQDNIAPVPDQAQLPLVMGECSVTVTAPTATDNCAGKITATTNDPVTYQAQGFYIIRWNYNDGNGNVTTQYQTVVVSDETAPLIATQHILVNTQPGLCGAVVNLGTPQTSDNCGVDSLFNDAPADGFFPIGMHVVIWTVKDVNGNTNTAMQLVRVMDNEKPVFTQPLPLTAYAAEGNCSAAITLPDPAVTDNCSVTSLTNNAPAQFPVGTTIVTWTAKDLYGNTATATQSVTVTDNQVPVISAPGNQQVVAANGSCQATVTTGTATASDNCGVSAVIGSRSDGQPLTAAYPVGVTTVTWTAIDIHGNTSQAAQTIQVTDNQQPVIIAPAGKWVSAAGNCQAAVDAGEATASDNCGVSNIAGVRSDGLPLTADYPVGVTTITWTATDIHGNASQATQLIKVTDNQLPTITAPAPVTANAGSNCTASSVTLGVPVTGDNCGVASVSNNAPATYPVGVTLVTWTVTDIHGNAQTAQQTVTVKDVQAPAISVPAAATVCDNGTGNYRSVSAIVTDNCGIQSVSYTVTGATNRSGNGANASGNFNAGVTTIKWTATDINGNTISASTTVTITASPVVTVSATSDPFCTGVTLTAAASPAGNYTYSWSYNNQVISSASAVTLGNANNSGTYTVKASTAGGCTTAAASYQYDKTTVFANYTIVASKEVNLGQNNQVQSGSIGATAANGEIEIKKNSAVLETGAFVKAKTIDLQNPVNIANKVYAPAVVSVPALQIYTGNYNGLSDYSSAQNANITLTGNYNKLLIRRGTNATLKGSTFKTVEIEEGATVSFTGTTLNMESLLVGTGAHNGTTTVRFAANTAVRVSKQVKIEEDCIINPDAVRVIFYVGDNSCDEEKFKVTGGNTRVTANVILPNGKIKVDGNGNSTVWMTGHFVSQAVEAANNVVWNVGGCSTSTNIVANGTAGEVSTAKSEAAAGVASALDIQLRPNPTVNSFYIQVRSLQKAPVTLRILDQHGRVMEAKNKVDVNTTIVMGTALQAGAYFIEAVQGTDRKVVKGIKLN